jgi:hypothetical protein
MGNGKYTFSGSVLSLHRNGSAFLKPFHVEVPHGMVV